MAALGSRREGERKRVVRWTAKWGVRKPVDLERYGRRDGHHTSEGSLPTMVI